MLLTFALENFRSYRRRKEFSLVASPIKELPSHLLSPEGLGMDVLRVAALYGANASGKSNLLAAAWFLGDLIRRGSDVLSREDSWLSCFALAPEAQREPTAFEVNFFVRDETYPRGIRFEYRVALRDRVVSEESLFAYPVGGRQQRWFKREGTSFKFSTALKGAHKKLVETTRPDTPYLWVAEKFGHTQLSVPARWLKRNFMAPFYFSLRFGSNEAARLLAEDDGFRAWATELLHHADLGIVGVRSERRKRYSDQQLEQMAPSLRERMAQTYQYDVAFLHRSSGEPVAMRLADQSTGTEHLFDLLAPMWLALRNGTVLFLDEMSASMHPLLTQRLVECFQDPHSNPKGAQLVLTTHDVSLLRSDLFRRDEIWFTEKDERGETDLYSLQDFQPRGDAALAKNYLAGRYGAVPFLGTFDFGADDGAKAKDEEIGRP